MFGVNFRSYPTFINIIMLCTCLCSCKGIWIAHALASNTPITPFDKTVGVLRLLHPLVEVDIALFIDDFHYDMEVILNQKALIFPLVCSPHFSFGGLLSMVYEFLQDYFVLDDSTSGFDLFFKNMCAHCSKSCSTFNFAFALCVLIPNVAIWRHTSHCDKWGDLLPRGSHTSYLI